MKGDFFAQKLKLDYTYIESDSLLTESCIWLEWEVGILAVPFVIAKKNEYQGFCKTGSISLSWNPSMHLERQQQ